MSLINLLVGLIFISSFFLILVIMVQEGKGGSKGIIGGGEVIGGVKETTNFLTKFTWIMAILFASLILISNIVLKPSVSVEQETENVTEEE